MVGFSNAYQQFSLIALRVSNKEDKKALSDNLAWIQPVCMEVQVDFIPDRTISENCDSILNYAQSLFPQATIGNCFLHLQKNIKLKKGSW